MATHMGPVRVLMNLWKCGEVWESKVWDWIRKGQAGELPSLILYISEYCSLQSSQDTQLHFFLYLATPQSMLARPWSVKCDMLSRQASLNSRSVLTGSCQVSVPLPDESSPPFSGRSGRGRRGSAQEHDAS